MQSPDKSPSPPDHKAANRRLGLILLSIVVVFFLGFFAKMKFLG
ncbi:cytochrome oxidase small assembly protein [Cupriavidus taiwanensis]|nr:cytochrome oxidase small assembly protein [Cupriavidus taiwanensis]